MSERMAETPATGELRRSRSNRMLAGVAGGLGAYFELHPAVFRVSFVVLTLMGGAGILIYLAAALVMPDEGKEDSVATAAFRRRRPWVLVVLGLVAVVPLALLSEAPVWPQGDAWPFLLIAGALALWLTWFAVAGARPPGRGGTGPAAATSSGSASSSSTCAPSSSPSVRPVSTCASARAGSASSSRRTSPCGQSPTRGSARSTCSAGGSRAGRWTRRSTRRASACSSSTRRSASGRSRSSEAHDERDGAAPVRPGPRAAGDRRRLRGDRAGGGGGRDPRPARLRPARACRWGRDPRLPRALGLREGPAGVADRAPRLRLRRDRAERDRLRRERDLRPRARRRRSLARAAPRPQPAPGRPGLLLRPRPGGRRRGDRGSRRHADAARAGSRGGRAHHHRRPLALAARARPRCRAGGAGAERGASRHGGACARLGPADARPDPAARSGAAARRSARTPAGARAARLALRRPAVRRRGVLARRRAGGCGGRRRGSPRRARRARERRGLPPGRPPEGRPVGRAWGEDQPSGGCRDREG